MKKSVLSGGFTFALLLFPLLSFTGCYSTVEVGDSPADKAISIDWVDPLCAEPGSPAGYIEGNGFGAENVTVTVGGIEAEVLAATGKDASFIVPAEGLSPGETIEVVVMNPGGRLATIQWVVCGFDCSAIDCTSGNECVEDGTCDPATGTCIDGGNQPADTACGDGNVCDEQGNCVECNDAAQCTEDDNDCTAASCIDGACGQSDLLDGTMCDLLSVGDGVCMSGACEAAPDCTGAADCDDGNQCTADTCDPAAEMCVHTPVGDGAVCDFGGLPGICVVGICEEDLCADVDCEDGDPCTIDSCDPLSGTCINVFICEDTDPPVLTGFDFNPKQIDVSTQSQQVTCDISVADSGVGVNYARCIFVSPTDYPRWCSATQPSSGDDFDGVFSCAVDIPQGSEAGTWTVDRIHMVDIAGNEQYVYTPELDALGFPTLLDVISLNADADPPVLTGFDFNPKQIDVSTQSQQVTCDISVADSGVGVNYARCIFVSPTDYPRWCSATQPSSGDDFDGVFSCAVDIPQGSEVGAWTVDRIHMVDIAGNEQYVYTPELDALGFPTQLDVISLNADADPPVLTGFDFNPKQIDVSTQSQQVTCDISVADSGVGVNYARCIFVSPTDYPRWCSATQPSSGDDFDGVFSCAVDIPQGSEAGTWTVDRIHMVDIAGNEQYVYTPELDALGFPTLLDVIYGSP